jgi:AcrR family transcriptional regulator
MDEAEGAKGRSRDANRTREAILAAAEAVFADLGFAGARLDGIAAYSSYNKSLIGQYFGDKLGLYTEVLKRADGEVDALLARVLAPMLEDESVVSDAHRFRTYLETMTGAFFDYLSEHPRLLRILTWEMADGWRTFAVIAQGFPSENSERFEAFFRNASSAGLLRSDFLPKIQFSMLMQVCQVHFSFSPLYRLLLPNEDLGSAAFLARSRRYLVDFIVAGMLKDPGKSEEAMSSRR